MKINENINEIKFIQRWFIIYIIYLQNYVSLIVQFFFPFFQFKIRIYYILPDLWSLMDPFLPLPLEGYIQKRFLASARYLLRFYK